MSHSIDLRPHCAEGFPSAYARCSVPFVLSDGMAVRSAFGAKLHSVAVEDRASFTSGPNDAPRRRRGHAGGAADAVLHCAADAQLLQAEASTPGVPIALISPQLAGCTAADDMLATWRSTALSVGTLCGPSEVNEFATAIRSDLERNCSFRLVLFVDDHVPVPPVLLAEAARCGLPQPLSHSPAPSASGANSAVGIGALPLPAAGANGGAVLPHTITPAFDLCPAASLHTISGALQSRWCEADVARGAASSWVPFPPPLTKAQRDAVAAAMARAQTTKSADAAPHEGVNGGSSDGAEATTDALVALHVALQQHAHSLICSLQLSFTFRVAPPRGISRATGQHINPCMRLIAPPLRRPQYVRLALPQQAPSGSAPSILDFRHHLEGARASTWPRLSLHRLTSSGDFEPPPDTLVEELLAARHWRWLDRVAVQRGFEGNAQLPRILEELRQGAVAGIDCGWRGAGGGGKGNPQHSRLRGRLNKRRREAQGLLPLPEGDYEVGFTIIMGSGRRRARHLFSARHRGSFDEEEEEEDEEEEESDDSNSVAFLKLEDMPGLWLCVEGFDELMGSSAMRLRRHAERVDSRLLRSTDMRLAVQSVRRRDSSHQGSGAPAGEEDRRSSDGDDSASRDGEGEGAEEQLQDALGGYGDAAGINDFAALFPDAAAAAAAAAGRRHRGAARAEDREQQLRALIRRQVVGDNRAAQRGQRNSRLKRRGLEQLSGSKRSRRSATADGVTHRVISVLDPEMFFAVGTRTSTVVAAGGGGGSPAAHSSAKDCYGTHEVPISLEEKVVRVRRFPHRNADVVRIVDPHEPLISLGTIRDPMTGDDYLVLNNDEGFVRVAGGGCGPFVVPATHVEEVTARSQGQKYTAVTGRGGSADLKKKRQKSVAPGRRSPGSSTDEEEASDGQESEVGSSSSNRSSRSGATDGNCARSAKRDSSRWQHWSRFHTMRSATSYVYNCDQWFGNALAEAPPAPEAAVSTSLQPPTADPSAAATAIGPASQAARTIVTRARLFQAPEAAETSLRPLRVAKLHPVGVRPAVKVVGDFQPCEALPRAASARVVFPCEVFAAFDKVQHHPLE